MPTYDADDRFWHDYERLRPDQRAAFLRAVRAFRAALTVWEEGGCAGFPPFPAGLRVKKMSGHRDIWEMSWAPDGRCTWGMGNPIHLGRMHVTWRRIGSHAIFDNP